MEPINSKEKLDKIINEEYKENPEISRDEIKKLLEWIKQQPHLPEISEIEAIQFFHSCLFSMEFAKQTIDINFTVKTHCPEFFSGWNFQNEDLQKIMKTVGIFPLNNKTPEGYRIIWGKLCDFEVTNYNFSHALKLFCMIFQMWLLGIGAAPGHIIVLDLNGVTLGHITRLGPLIMKKFLYYLQEAAQIRIKGFHFINIVPHTDKIIALMKPFMKKELAQVLHLHSKMESLEEFIPKEVLPADYGGNDDTSENIKKNIYELAIQNQEFFTKEEQRRVNENLRPGKPQNASSLFGVEGNFKTLDID